MLNFKEALMGIDAERMHRVAGNYASTISSPEDNTVAKLAQYDGFNVLVVGLGDRVKNSGRFTPEEAKMFMAGAIACLDVFADYADTEQLEQLVYPAQ